MKPQTANRLDAMFPTWAACALVAFVTISLVILFFA